MQKQHGQLVIHKHLIRGCTRFQLRDHKCTLRCPVQSINPLHVHLHVKCTLSEQEKAFGSAKVNQSMLRWKEKKIIFWFVFFSRKGRLPWMAHFFFVDKCVLILSYLRIICTNDTRHRCALPMCAQTDSEAADPTCKKMMPEHLNHRCLLCLLCEALGVCRKRYY